MIGAIIENDFRFADLYATAGCEGYRAFDGAAVIKCSVGGAEILQVIFFAFATHLGMHSRSKGIGNAQIVAS